MITLCIVALNMQTKPMKEAIPCETVQCIEFYQKAVIEGYWRPIVMLNDYKWYKQLDETVCLGIK